MIGVGVPSLLCHPWVGGPDSNEEQSKAAFQHGLCFTFYTQALCLLEFLPWIPSVDGVQADV